MDNCFANSAMINIYKRVYKKLQNCGGTHFGPGGLTMRATIIPYHMKQASFASEVTMIATMAGFSSTGMPNL